MREPHTAINTKIIRELVAENDLPGFMKIIFF